MKPFLYFLLFFSHRAYASEPITDFCLKNNINQKSVLIALSLNDCRVCFMPPDELLTSIREINSEIPIYIITDEILMEVEKALFKNKLGAYSNEVIFIADKVTYQYMVTKKGGIPSVCCVSERGKVLAFKHLKYESLDDFFHAIKPTFSVFLINKVELQNKFVSPKKSYRSFIKIDDNLYLFYTGYNIICKYNMRGVNTQNLFIDSLNFDYLQLAKQIFEEKEYQSSENHYKEITQKKKSQLFSPVGMMKMGQDTLCLLVDVTSFIDTALKSKKIIAFEQKYLCLFLFDTAFKYLGLKSFYPLNEAKMIEPIMGATYFNAHAYMQRYRDNSFNSCSIAEYEQQNSTFILRRTFDTPQMKKKYPLPVINPVNKNYVYMTYFKSEKDRINHTTLYKLNIETSRLFKEVEADMFILPSNIYETQTGNYILQTAENGIISIKGYHTAKKEFINSQEQLNTKKQNTNSVFFVFGGYIQEYTYTE